MLIVRLYYQLLRWHLFPLINWCSTSLLLLVAFSTVTNLSTMINIYHPLSSSPFALQMILQQMELITSTDVVRNLCKKMAPPLVTLLSAEPEIQYVALRNINLIVQRRPTILAHEIKVSSTLYIVISLYAD